MTRERAYLIDRDKLDSFLKNLTDEMFCPSQMMGANKVIEWIINNNPLVRYSKND